MAKKTVRVHPKVGRPTRLLPIGAVVTCVNTPAKKAKIMGVYKLQGAKRRSLSAGVGNLVNLTIVKGPEQMKHKMMKGVIVRQVAPYLRYGRGKIFFQDNGVMLLGENGQALKGVIRGVVAKEITAIPEFADINAKIV